MLILLFRNKFYISFDLNRVERVPPRSENTILRTRSAATAGTVACKASKTVQSKPGRRYSRGPKYAMQGTEYPPFAMWPWPGAIGASQGVPLCHPTTSRIAALQLSTIILACSTLSYCVYCVGHTQQLSISNSCPHAMCVLIYVV